MATWGRCDFSQFKNLQKKLEKMVQADIDKFCADCTKELAARLLGKVIKRTPVGVYDKPVKFVTKTGQEVSFTPSTGKLGGTLRRGWTAGKENTSKKGNVVGVSGKTGHAQSLNVYRSGSLYVIVVKNIEKYASYVEFGHRTKNHKGWVPGRFMMTISVQELEQQAPAIIEKKLMKFLGGIFDGR